MIDGLSSIRYRRKLGAGARFVKFVRQYARWPEGERVSLPQAKLYLETYGGNVELLKEVSRRLEAWQSGQIQDLTHDPFPNELSGSGDVLQGCQHLWLLWALRNSLLHGFRHPAFAHDDLSAIQDAPY